MRFILFISIIQSILFLGHWFFYKTLVRFLGVTQPSKLLTLKIGLALLSVSLVLTSLLAFYYSNLIARFFYTIAVSWLGIFYLFVLASLLCWIIDGLAGIFQFPLDRRLLIEILMGIALAASFYGFVNGSMIRTTKIDLKIPNLPISWKGKKAIWVSDTHLGHVRNHGFAQRIVKKIRELHPDIIFIGGDLYDGLVGDLGQMIEPFSKISTPHGTYFVTGNHEEFNEPTSYLRAIQRAGIRVLYNEKVELDGLQIVGVDYMDSRSEEGFKAVLQKINIHPQKPSILLKHSPSHLQVARDHGISLQLSGHTHQGQVFLFRFITSRIYKGYDYGLKSFGDLLVYTSSGAGTWGPPMRLDTNPEILLITFR